MKFPRTRRDRLCNNAHIQKPDAEGNFEDFPDALQKPRYNGSSHVAPSEPATEYPSQFVPGGPKNAFSKESVQPLGANVESWSNLVDASRATSRMNEYGEDELMDNDDVFFTNDDMRNMRLGIGGANIPYYPGAYSEIAMNTAKPGESHFGQGLAYYGPSYHVGASSMEIFFLCWGMMTYLLDVGSDIFIAYLYFTKGHYAWFSLTISFVAVPSITMTIFSVVLYMKDHKIAKLKRSRCRWASRIIFLMLQFAPFFRMVETLIYGCKSRDEDRDIIKRRMFYDKMVDEDTDSMLIRLFESFMEAAPQLVLQLYIITQVGTDTGVFLVVMQCFGLATSLINLATVLVSYQKSLRLSLPDKEKLRFPGMAIMFLWRLFTIAARVLAVAMFASYFKFWTFVALGIHWAGMLVWTLKQNTRYCVSVNTEGEEVHNKCHEILFRILASFVHIFCFFNLIEGHTRLRCLLFYLIIYIENAIFILGWYIGAGTITDSAWYHMPSLLVVLLGFWFGILFQVTYYKCYHPNNYSVLQSRSRILWCIKCEFLSLTQEAHFRTNPAVSEINKSQLSLNQTLQSMGGVPFPGEKPYIASTPAPIQTNLQPQPVPVRQTPAPRQVFSDTQSILSSRPGSISRAPGPYRPKIVQRKWDPEERPAAGEQKLNETLNSDSTSTTTGSRYTAASAEDRAQRRARKAKERARAIEAMDPHNEEPLPIYTRRGVSAASTPTSSLQREPFYPRPTPEGYTQHSRVHQRTTPRAHPPIRYDITEEMPGEVDSDRSDYESDHEEQMARQPLRRDRQTIPEEDEYYNSNPAADIIKVTAI